MPARLTVVSLIPLKFWILNDLEIKDPATGPEDLRPKPRGPVPAIIAKTIPRNPRRWTVAHSLEYYEPKGGIRASDYEAGPTQNVGAEVTNWTASGEGPPGSSPSSRFVQLLFFFSPLFVILAGQGPARRWLVSLGHSAARH